MTAGCSVVNEWQLCQLSVSAPASLLSTLALEQSIMPTSALRGRDCSWKVSIKLSYSYNNFKHAREQPSFRKIWHATQNVNKNRLQ